MIRNAFAVLICMSLIFTSGCGVIDKITGSAESERLFYRAVEYGNTELIDELIEAKSINHDTLESGLYKSYNTAGDTYIVMKHMLEKGADSSYRNMLVEFAYNDDILQVAAMLSDKNTDVNISKDGYSALYQAMENQKGGNEWLSYKISEMLVEKGAKIEDKLFVNEGSADDYRAGYKQINSNPLTVRMLIKKHLANGGKPNIPDAVKYAFCGEIGKSIAAIEKSNTDLTKVDGMVITNFASAFGTVEQYEKICGLFSTDCRFPAAVIASCGNIPMLEYSLNKDGVTLKVGKNEIEDLSFANHYTQYADCLSYAAIWGEYDVCKYLCENEIKPILGNGYEALSNAVTSGNFELVKYIYSYITKYDGRISEDYMGQTLRLVGKRRGSYVVLNEFDKKLYQFLFKEGYKFSNFPVEKYDTQTNSYLIENGMKLSDENLKYLAMKNDIDALKSAFKKGFKPTEEMFSTAVTYASHDTVKLIIDSGVKLPDDIMETAKDGSKATAKVLIEAGAKTDLKYTRLEPANGGGVVKQGDFDLSDYYKHYGRDDLSQLLD